MLIILNMFFFVELFRKRSVPLLTSLILQCVLLKMVRCCICLCHNNNLLWYRYWIGELVFARKIVFRESDERLMRLTRYTIAIHLTHVTNGVCDAQGVGYVNASVVYLNGSLWYESLNFSCIQTVAIQVFVNGNKNWEFLFSCYITHTAFHLRVCTYVKYYG